MPTPQFIVELRRHFGRRPLWLIGVTAVVLRRRTEGSDSIEVLLVRRSDTGEWAPVSGIVDPGEDPHVCAVREAAEETCVQIRVERMVWMCAGDLVEHANGDQCWYLDHTFRCQWVSGEPRVGDDESLEVRWWLTEALPAMRAHYADRVACALADEPETRLGP
ncbi:MAG TPA: NUDIX domain-containing protein [Dermatophilaceae bacterium]|nr:NUDIX domain-containing protein [Dermatophilaceae bacterium]